MCYVDQGDNMPLKLGIKDRFKRWYSGSIPKEEPEDLNIVGKCSKCQILAIYTAELEKLHSKELKTPAVPHLLEQSTTIQPLRRMR